DIVAELRASLAGQTEAIDAVTGSLGGSSERLIAAGQGLLAYLGERDLWLERERDRILHEVLDEFAQGLSAKERRAVSSRMSEALDRRRDSRDAERYRRTKAGKPAVDIPPVPTELREIGSAMPSEVPSEAPSDVPAWAAAAADTTTDAAADATATPAAKTGPTKRTSTKRAAKQTATKQAVAKKAATKQTATKTAASKGSAAKRSTTKRAATKRTTASKTTAKSSAAAKKTTARSS